MNIIYSLVVILSLFVVLNSAQSSLILVKEFQNQNCYTANCKSNVEVTGGTILKQNQCVVFKDTPSIFSTYDPLASIVQTNYIDQNCNGVFLGKTYYRINYCNSTNIERNICKPFQASVINDLDIPLNSIVSVQYSQPQCNGQFKNSFNIINYQSINICNSNASGSFKLTCNGTSSTIFNYSDDSCSSLVSSSTTPLSNECGDSNNNYSNLLQFCNN